MRTGLRMLVIGLAVLSMGCGVEAATVLLVVPNPGSLTAEEQTKKTTMEGWGYTVVPIAATATQTAFNNAIATSDVAYVSETTLSGDLGTKLRNAPIGVLCEEQASSDEFGVSSSSLYVDHSQVNITDNTHYITSPFSTGVLTICTSVQPLHARSGTLSTDLIALAQRVGGTEGILAMVDEGGALYGGGTAAGRRVMMPWGRDFFSTSSLTADGRTIWKRSLEWALGSTFTDVSASTGFNVATTTDESYGAGLQWGDVDNDGDLDAIVGGNTARVMVNNNQGAGFFATAMGNLCRSGALIDIDNDGDLDFWSVNRNSNNTEVLLQNDLSSFSESDLGFTAPTNNEALAMGDFNMDGWVDIVMCSENGNWIGMNNQTVPATITGSNSSFYGLQDAGDLGNGDYLSSADVNNDNVIDFFYHWSGGKLFLSDGDGTYTDTSAGISVVTSNTDKFGSAWGDYDNDGDMDLFASRFASGQPGYLWRNNGNGTFTNVAAAAGITNTGSQRGCCWGDYDNDGDLDLFIAMYSGASVLYNNEGDGTFIVAADAPSVSGLGHDAVFVDYDNDGDLDLAVTIEDSTNLLLRNNLDNTNYLKVRLIGLGAGATNVACVGTRIELYDAAGTGFIARREIGIARGFGGTEPLWAHFGGVDPAVTYTLKVYFLNGIVSTTVVPQNVSTTIGATTVDQMITITEPDDAVMSLTWEEIEP